MRHTFYKKYFLFATAIAALALAPVVRAQSQEQVQEQDQSTAPANQEQQPTQQVLRIGTPISVLLNQMVSSKTAKVGQKVEGKVAAPVVVDGKTVIPRGAKANLSVASVQAAAPQAGPTRLMLQLDSIEVKGKTLVVSATLAGRLERPIAQPDDVVHNDSSSGSMVASARVNQGELIGTSAYPNSSADRDTSGNVQRDVNFSARTKLSFTLRSALQLQ